MAANIFFISFFLSFCFYVFFLSEIILFILTIGEDILTDLMFQI